MLWKCLVDCKYVFVTSERAPPSKRQLTSNIGRISHTHYTHRHVHYPWVWVHITGNSIGYLYVLESIFRILADRGVSPSYWLEGHYGLEIVDVDCAVSFPQLFARFLSKLTTGLDVRQSIIQLCASSNHLPNTGEGWLASLKQHGNLIYQRINTIIMVMRRDLHQIMWCEKYFSPSCDDINVITVSQ